MFDPKKQSWLALSFLLLACGGQSESEGTGGSGGAGAGGSGGGGGSGALGGGGTGALGGGGTGAVDGGSGGMGAGGSGGTSVGGAPGGGGAPCSALEAAYTSALASAKSCNPFIDMEECTAKVPDALACPCGLTFVNPSNAQAMKTMADTKYFWDQQKCGEGIGCPAIACEDPALGSCQPDSTNSGGVCQDMYKN